MMAAMARGAFAREAALVWSGCSWRQRSGFRRKWRACGGRPIPGRDHADFRGHYLRLQRRINSFDGAAVEESSACCGVNLAVRVVFGVLVGRDSMGMRVGRSRAAMADCQVIARSKPGSHIAKWMTYST